MTCVFSVTRCMVYPLNISIWWSVYPMIISEGMWVRRKRTGINFCYSNLKKWAFFSYQNLNFHGVKWELCFLGHIKRMPPNRYLKIILGAYTHGERPRGWPAKWWEDCVKEDLRSYDLDSLAEATRLAQNKKFLEQKPSHSLGLVWTARSRSRKVGEWIWTQTFKGTRWAFLWRKQDSLYGILTRKIVSAGIQTPDPWVTEGTPYHWAIWLADDWA